MKTQETRKAANAYKNAYNVLSGIIEEERAKGADTTQHEVSRASMISGLSELLEIGKEEAMKIITN